MRADCGRTDSSTRRLPYLVVRRLYSLRVIRGDSEWVEPYWYYYPVPSSFLLVSSPWLGPLILLYVSTTVVPTRL